MGELTASLNQLAKKFQVPMTLPQISVTTLQNIFENSTDAILVAKAGVQITANPAFLSIFGYASLDELAGKPILDILAPIEHQRVTDYISRRSQGEIVPLAYECVGRRQDGSEFMVEIRILTYKQDEDIYSLIILHDITEQKRTEKALRESEEKFRKVFQYSQVAISITKLATAELVDVNNAYEQILGHSQAEIIGKSALEINLWKDPRVREKAMSEYIKNRTAQLKNLELQSKSGKTVLVDANFALIDVDNEVYSIAMFSDLTDQKQAEEALRESKAMLEAAFNNMQYPITVGHNGMQIMVNPAAAEVFGYSSPDECINQPIISIIAPSERPRIASYLKRRWEGLAAPSHYQTRGLKKDGSEFDIEVLVSPYKIENEVYTLAAIRDLTEEKRLQRAEREQREFANALSQAATILNQTLNLDMFVEKIMDLVGQVVTYDAASIVQVENGIMNAKSMRGFTPQVMELIEAGHFQLVNGDVATQMMRTRQPVVMDFPPVDGMSFNEIPGFEAQHNRMAIPVMVQKEVIGFLLLIKREPGFYTQKHVDRMTAFASHIASAYLNAQLFERQRELLQQVVLAQEEERQRVARELHDEAGQALTAVTLNLQLVRDEIGRDSDWGQKVDDAIQLVHSTAEQIRNISYGLRPPLIDVLGLNLAMRDLCQDIAKRAAIEIRFTGQNLLGLSDAINISLYRILQETLTNVLRHADATQVIVKLSATQTHVFLSISDNGKGFSTSQVGLGSTERRGLGLLGMRERADLINGKLEIRSSPGQGTQIHIIVPKG